MIYPFLHPPVLFKMLLLQECLSGILLKFFFLIEGVRGLGTSEFSVGSGGDRQRKNSKGQISFHSAGLQKKA